jgi:hypothetical protein
MPYMLTAMRGVVINNQIFYAGGYTPGTYAVPDSSKFTTLRATPGLHRIYRKHGPEWHRPLSVR